MKQPGLASPAFIQYIERGKYVAIAQSHFEGLLAQLVMVLESPWDTDRDAVRQATCFQFAAYPRASMKYETDGQTSRS